MTWIVSLFALIGVILNIYKKKSCFIIWAFTNLFWCIYDWQIGAKAQSVLFGVYFLLAIWGLIQWAKEPVVENKYIKRKRWREKHRESRW